MSTQLTSAQIDAILTTEDYKAIAGEFTELGTAGTLLAQAAGSMLEELDSEGELNTLAAINLRMAVLLYRIKSEAIIPFVEAIYAAHGINLDGELVS